MPIHRDLSSYTYVKGEKCICKASRGYACCDIYFTTSVFLLNISLFAFLYLSIILRQELGMNLSMRNITG